ncbi:hypothetical protein INR49_012188 [Caranx melampygus]|nr:hypothetical protein INR49_012188 [Caranx melampygus]
MAGDESGTTLGQPHLAKQDLSSLDVTTLTPLSQEIISRQATINIGTIGHVAHGKSTVVKAISGVHTVRFKNELERNITIKLGYANAKIYKLDDASCPRPECYRSCGSSTPDEFPTDIPGTKGNFKLVRHVSFVDCPGHDILMATMLNGAAVMDAALLLIAGNESCPQPQTSEHLAAIEIMKLKHILILQNKIDLVKESQAKEHVCITLESFRGTVAEGAPIIPISAQLKYNIEVVCEYIVKKIPVPVRDFTSEPRLIVIRSFDVNKPGCEVDDLKGGVAGGSILKGVLKVGQEIEVRPGIVSKDQEGKLMCKPIFSKIVSLFAEHNDLQYAAPGGLIGVGTKIDPTLCRADRMVGQVLGAVGALPEIFTELEISYFLLRRLLGVRTEGDKKAAKVQKLSKNEVLMVNIGSLSTGGRVSAVKADLAKIVLTNPVCTEVGEKIALSRRVEKHWRLIGWGQIRRGVTITPTHMESADGQRGRDGGSQRRSPLDVIMNQIRRKRSASDRRPLGRFLSRGSDRTGIPEDGETEGREERGQSPGVAEESERDIGWGQVCIFLQKLGKTADSRSLSVAHCDLTATDLLELAILLQFLPQLEELDVSWNKLIGGSLKALTSHLHHVGRIRMLRLCSCRLNADDITALGEALGCLPLLEVLDLSWNDAVGGGGLHGLLGKLQPPLREIHLVSCQLTAADATALGGIVSTLPGLSVLDVSCNPQLAQEVDDGGFRELAASLSHATSLAVLRLQGCGLTASCLHSLGGLLQRLTSVQELDLSCNKGLAGGLNHFTHHLTHLTHLESLDLHMCSLTHSDLEALGECKCVCM